MVTTGAQRAPRWTQSVRQPRSQSKRSALVSMKSTGSCGHGRKRGRKYESAATKCEAKFETDRKSFLLRALLPAGCQLVPTCLIWICQCSKM